MKWQELEDYTRNAWDKNDGLAWLLAELTAAMPKDELDEYAEHITRVWDLNEGEGE